MAKLTIKDENGDERIHELTDDVTSIGRSSNNTIKITDAKSSRNHFRVEKDGAYFKVVDLGSTNGTKVNGVRVTSQRLRQGDVLSVGLTTFAYDGPSDGAYEATVKMGQEQAAAVAAASAPQRSSGPDLNASAPSSAATPAPAVETAVTVPSTSIDAKALAAMQAKAGEGGPKYVLAILEGKEAGRTVNLGQEAVTLGRSSSNTIKIEDDAASSYHAEITKAPIGYVISDLGSTNGTRVKARGAADFEKIVKTPLAPGMQIRIGKTVIEFRNLGRPGGEDQLFGTVVLNEGGEGHLAAAGLADRPAKKGSPLAVVGVAAVVFFVIVVYVVVKLIPENPVDPKPPVTPPKQTVHTGEVENGDFSKGTDDHGNPNGWKPVITLPEVRVVVDKEAERNADKPEEQRKGLRISKAGTSPSTRTVVESMDSLAVEPGKVYEISGALKNDGDGQFGLRLVWIKGERSFAEHPLTLSGTQQEWKDRNAKVKPPPWADRVKVGVFTEGREGKTFFDNIAFKELPGEKLADPPSVSYGGVTVNFEGGKGAFAVSSGGQAAIDGALLELASKDNQSVSSLLSAFETQPVTDSGKTTYRGQLFDFQLQRPANYLISAQAGSGGVQMRFAVDRSQGDSGPRLNFYIVGPAAKGEIDARLDSGPQKISANENKTLAGMQEILFNTGGTPQLYLNFASPVTLETRREGERRWVQIAFQGELGVEIAPENVGEKQQFANASKDLDDALSRKDWARVYKLSDTIDQKYGSKMPEAKDKVRQARAAFDDAFKTVKDDLVRQIDTVKQAPTTADDALKSIDRQMAPWIGTSKEQDFRDAKQQIEKLKTAGANTMKEDLAAQALKSAQTSYNKGVYTVAISFCNKILRDFPDTAAAKEAKDLLAKADDAQKKEDELGAITAGLKKQVEAFIKAGDYAEAIKTITNDAEYKKHSTQLKEINELLETWKAKAGQ
ncbi:MAG: FHA domain-containing protein [Planctomycetes bacterium]|nr:FHA domain-containing protein [Planctomycetota bacterium]